MEKLMISVAEAAELSGVSLRTIYEWAKRPGFPIVKMGRNSRVPVKLFEAWLDEQAALGWQAQEDKTKGNAEKGTGKRHGSANNRIIRCAECGYFVESEQDSDWDGSCGFPIANNVLGICVDKDDYCSRAEKRNA